MGRMDRLIMFDDETGALECEAGVTFGDLLRVLLPKGFMPPVMPGTGFVTLGGGVASDIHGKNHHRVGSLGQHIEWIDLRKADGSLLRVNATIDDPIFRATVGGMGLTGIIERVALRTTRVPSNALRVKRRRISNLQEFLTAFESQHEIADFTVGWIDALSGGRHLGRGVFESAVHANVSLTEYSRPEINWPLDAPEWFLNSYLVKAFNAIYLARHSAADRESTEHIREFMFPLDQILNWNRMYGKRGFHQFQCVIPPQTAETALSKMLEIISKSKSASPLVVLKAMGQPGVGYLSFPISGYTLAVDFPNRHHTRELLSRLEEMSMYYGGRVYLTKDSFISENSFKFMYSEAVRFIEQKKLIDPNRFFQSDLSRRLNV
jgi:decaprenylphospho-beta-D-ribofuranose 2-oxidase